MSLKLIRLCLALCLFLPLVHSVTAAPADNTELQVFKVQTEAKIDAAKESQQKDLQLNQQLIASQHERIEQINHQVDWLGNLIALGSLIITLLLVIIGYFAYGKAKSDAEIIAKKTAKDEANTTSKAEVKRWFDDNLAAVSSEINALKDRLNQLAKEVDAHAEQAHQKIDKANADLQTHASQIIANHPLSADAKSTLTEMDKQTLDAANTSLQNKPESQYTFDDWNTRAHAEYAKGNLSLAAEYWRNAAHASQATDLQVAEALNNQSVTLGRQNQPDEAIACSQQIVQHFSDSTLPALQVQVAIALVNQGAMLWPLDKLDEAIACCLQVVQRYGDSTLPALQERVARALNGHGFTLLIKAKHVWNDQAARTELLTESLSLFERALGKSHSDSDKATAQGNVAYALWLLGRKDEVETRLREALTLGGEKSFNDEISDTKLSPVPPDGGFEQLVNRLWSEINQKE